ncbi:Dbh-like monooxygenase [Thalictrum thalictroides]|uniref:Dbh-like monooxygenase n=1 Tax=Thalictrum thalictroides TaxID=46969 RepID=A0A7J6V914_THATH|nr:Dbh-like monooxygenase [Thalictrum thalictroides]
MKRKDVDEVSNDFSDFSLSSPATKIRRLNGELSPIMEVELEEEPRMDMGLNPFQVQAAVEVTEPSSSTVMMMPEPEPLNNEERALVLYKPVNATLWKSPDVSITVNQDLIPSFKNGIFWPGHSDCVRLAEDQPDFKDKDETNDCLAVVPWVSYQLPFSSGGDGPAMTEVSEPMEAEDAEGGTMEIEESVDTRAYEGLQHWQQQHCMTPQVPPSTAATPIMWS